MQHVKTKLLGKVRGSDLSFGDRVPTFGNIVSDRIESGSGSAVPRLPRWIRSVYEEDLEI